MKISPMPAAGNSVAAPGGQAEMRSIPVSVNRTPGREYEAAQAPADGGPPQGFAAPVQNDDKIQHEGEQAPEETKPLSPQYAALAKQRRALQVEREAFEKEKASAPKGLDLARLKSDPLVVLGEAGVTYEQLTQAILANPVNPEMDSLKAQIKALEEGVDKRLTDRDVAAERQVLAEMRREAEGLAADDQFELVRETGSVPKVMKLIERTYRETGEVLDVAEAMNLIETELLKDAEKLAALKKVQGRFAPQQPPQQRMRTLTNRDTASQTPLSAKARALAAFYGTLKK